MYLGRGACYHDIKDKFKRGITVVRCYHAQVLEELVKLSADVIRPYQDFNVVPTEITNSNGMYWPYFKVQSIYFRQTHSYIVRAIYLSTSYVQDCIGALDDTHVKALVGEVAGDAHRSRKGDNTWNDLIIVSLDTMITYVNVGWEGSAHDMTVL